MIYEPTPIQMFVSQKYQSQAIQKIVENWRVEPQLIVDKLVDHFREMGIYRVPFNQDRLLMADLLRYLKTSPDLMRLVSKARNEEARRQRNRHSD